MTHWLIVGCGYTGTALARELVARPALAAEVTITRRDGEAARTLAAALGVRGVRAELADAASLDVPAGAIVVCAAPPGEDPAGEIRTLLAAARGAAKLIYISSTGVYAPGHGAEVDESWPIAPITASGRARAVAEAELVAGTAPPFGGAAGRGTPTVDAAMPWVSLRAAGIYGPGRGLVERVRAGTYRVIGDGTSHVGRIHVVDLVAAILAAAATPVTGAVNVCDDDPAPIGAVADAVAARLGLPPPPRTPVDTVPAEVTGMLTADRRLVNRRLRDELGVVLRYPSWRDALEEELASPTA